jgi:hypothetical protein
MQLVLQRFYFDLSLLVCALFWAMGLLLLAYAAQVTTDLAVRAATSVSSWQMSETDLLCT